MIDRDCRQMAELAPHYHECTRPVGDCIPCQVYLEIRPGPGNLRPFKVGRPR